MRYVRIPVSFRTQCRVRVRDIACLQDIEDRSQSDGERRSRGIFQGCLNDDRLIRVCGCVGAWVVVYWWWWWWWCGGGGGGGDGGSDKKPTCRWRKLSVYEMECEKL